MRAFLSVGVMGILLIEEECWTHLTADKSDSLWRVWNVERLSSDPV